MYQYQPTMVYDSRAREREEDKKEKMNEDKITNSFLATFVH